MNTDPIVELLDFAQSLARKAGEVIKNHFDLPKAIQTKADGSPVTEVDQAINQLVISAIQQHYSDHAILGEEANLGTGNERNKWICDPLDGTSAFIAGIPNSVFMLALLQDQSLSLSVVYNPFTEELHHAIQGQGAFRNNEPIWVNNQTIANGRILLGAHSHSFVDEITKIGGKTEEVAGSGYKSMLIANGQAIGTIKRKSDFHDINPATLIIEEAGGRVTDLNGSPLIPGQELGGVIISNGTCHEELIEIAQKTIEAK